MRRSALRWSWLAMVGVACSSGGGGQNAGSAGAGQTAGTSGAAGKGGSGGSTGGGGGATGGGAGSSIGGTTGGGGRGGGGGTIGAGGSGAGGAAGATGTGGAAGGAGTSGGAGGSGGRGGAGGSSGAGGAAGRGGSGGAGGGAGGSAGAAGTGGPLHVTLAQALPNFQGAPRLVVVDGQDIAAVVGPSSTSTTDDPGPTVTWFPPHASSHSTTFANAITPSAIAVDPGGNLWMVGQLFRAATFGGTTLQPVDGGYYIVRIGGDGSFGLGRAVTRVGSVNVRAAVTDPQSNLYVVGSRFAGTPPADSIFVTKFSPAGDEIYNREFVGLTTSAEAADVAVAPNGTVYIVGTYGGPVMFGSTLLTLPSTSIDSGFVAALDATGALSWVMRFGGADFDVGNSIEVTSGGALRIAGLLTGTASVGGVPVQAAADGSPFVAELTAAGAANWVKLIDGTGIVFAADTNAAGQTFAVGYVNDNSKYTFVTDVAADGTATQPIRELITDDSNGASSVAADRHGGVWVAGDFRGSISFGGTVYVPPDPTGFGDFLVHLEP